MTREVGNIQIYLHVSWWCLVLHPFSPHSRCGLLEFLSGVRHEPTLNYPKNEFQGQVFKINSCPVIWSFILAADLWRRATSLSFLLSDSQQQSSRLHTHILLWGQITSCRHCDLQAKWGEGRQISLNKTQDKYTKCWRCLASGLVATTMDLLLHREKYKSSCTHI